LALRYGTDALSASQLRRIQAERIEVGKMKQLCVKRGAACEPVLTPPSCSGMQTSSKMGVRMDSKFQ
jgi:hypothetical protein